MAVSDITLGSGFIFLNGWNCGHLSGEVAATLETTLKKFLAGVPQRTIVQVPQGSVFKLKAGLAEISAENLAIAMGQQAITHQAAGPETVLTNDAEMHTFRADRPHNEQFIWLGPGPGMAKTFTAVVLKSEDGEDTYVAGTDYTLDAVTGKVTRISGGAIPSLGKVQAAYQFLLVAGKKLDIGFEQPLTDALLHFVHINPLTKLKTHVVMWKAMSDGQFNLPFGEDFVKNDVTWEALEDSSRTSDSLGYVFQEVAA